MTDLDNRMRLEGAKVDFDISGITGQYHDNYPQPNTQARYDLMRTVIIGLLSNQSCDETIGEPFEKRTGTLWFKKNSKFLDIYNGEKFDELSKYISATFGEEKKSLYEIIENILLNLKYSAPRVIWCGRFINGGNNHFLPIPEEYQGYAAVKNMHPLVYINGLLIDPRDTIIQPGSPAYIKISDNVNIKPNQKFVVILEHVTDITQEDIIGQG